MVSVTLIDVRGLRKTYGATVAVDHIDLTVDPGEILGILGHNGSGKTTTVECIAGLRRPDGGTVRVAGHDPFTDRDAITPLMGVQLQQAGLQPKLTVREAMELYASFYDDPVDGIALLERLGLAAKLDTRYAQLSGGQQQRLAIGLALVGRPRIALLDELSTGLDPRSRRDVWAVVEEMRETGTTVVLVTHLMEEARHLCDRIALFDGGRVRALDTVAGIIGQAGAPTLMTFEAAIDPARLEEIDGVAQVRPREGDRVELNLTDDAVHHVLTVLTTQGVRPERLRITEATLDEAYLDLTAEPETEGV